MNSNAPKIFVQCNQVYEHLNTDTFKILDLRDKSKFKKGHIPGAVHIESSAFISKNSQGYNSIIQKSDLEATLQAKGINNGDELILVDDVFNLSCSMAAWTLHYFDYTKLKIIDGALAKWEVENLPMTSKKTEVKRGNIQFTGKNDDILVTKDQILYNLTTDRNWIYVDNRSEYAMKLDSQGGYLPKAIHLWWMDLFIETEEDYFILKPLDVLEKNLVSLGIKKSEHIVLYCEQAPQSALVYLLLYDLNYPHTKLYLAGYEEWRQTCANMF